MHPRNKRQEEETEKHQEQVGRCERQEKYPSLVTVWGTLTYTKLRYNPTPPDALATAYVLTRFCFFKDTKNFPSEISQRHRKTQNEVGPQINSPAPIPFLDTDLPTRQPPPPGRPQNLTFNILNQRTLLSKSSSSVLPTHLLRPQTSSPLPLSSQQSSYIHQDLAAPQKEELNPHLSLGSQRPLPRSRP